MMGGFISVALLIFRTFVKIYLFPRLINIFNEIIKIEPIPRKANNSSFLNRNSINEISEIKNHLTVDNHLNNVNNTKLSKIKNYLPFH